MRTKAGFTLIELIAGIVLLGFIGIFAGTLFTLGARGTLAARQAEENGQKAQIALTRISSELHDITGGPGAGGAAVINATSISYTTNNTLLSGARVLAYTAASKTISISVGGGTAQTLVDQVSSCTMSASTTYATTFTVSFTLANSPGTFSITVTPRNTIITPVGS